MNKIMPIRYIDDECYYTKDKIIKVIKVFPINYELKSELEKEGILNSYNQFLKICNFNFKILVKSNKQDLDSTFSFLKDNIKDILISNNFKNPENEINEDITKLLDSYINFLVKLNENSKSSSKDFYILIYENLDSKKVNSIKFENSKDLDSKYLKNKKILLKDKEQKVVNNLQKCGNLTKVLQEKEIYNFLKLFYISEVNL